MKKQTSGRKQFAVCASSEAPVENNSQFTVTCVLCSGVCCAVVCTSCGTAKNLNYRKEGTTLFGHKHCTSDAYNLGI